MSISMADHSVEEIVAYIKYQMEHPDPERDAAHRRELGERVAAYERRFGFPSAEIHQRIDDGSLHEDFDVCDWLMTLSALGYDEEP